MGLIARPNGHDPDSELAKSRGQVRTDLRDEFAIRRACRLTLLDRTLEPKSFDDSAMKVYRKFDQVFRTAPRFAFLAPERVWMTRAGHSPDGDPKGRSKPKPMPETMGRCLCQPSAIGKQAEFEALGTSQGERNHHLWTQMEVPDSPAHGGQGV